MGHLFMFKEFFPLLINIIVFIILATSVQKAQSAYPQFQACKPQNCGKGPHISYPFYIPHVQESYCGHPNFEISCKDEKPFLKMSDEDYFIKDIFYKNNSLLVVNSLAMENDCPVILHNLTIGDTPFQFGPHHIDLYFFYNCTGTVPVDYPGFPITCLNNNTGHQSFVVFVHDWGQKYINYSSVTCNSVIRAPMDMDVRNVGNIDDMGDPELLREGFQLEWAGNNCRECEGSGGHCGFYQNEFVCGCPKGPRPRSCGDDMKLGAKLGIGLGAGGTLTLALIFFYCRRSRSGHLVGLAKTKNICPSSTPFTVTTTTNPPSKLDNDKGGGTYFGVPIFSYDELVEATNNFDSNRELGDGAFGTVYHGKLRDGRVVAVKRLYENTLKRVEQFMNEVEILTRLRHQNLVTLYGCTTRHSRELLLVYEYIPNGTVADHLHGDRAMTSPLTWPIRMSIAIETATALSYLHATDIIHRDVKTNNILLDNNFGVKVADFGLSRLFPPDVTHVSTAPQGTPGYVDPEYHQCYQLTDKSDVYSFGVVLIELISSKPAVDISRHRYEINLANMAINKIQNQTLHELVDPCLGFESDCAVRRMTTQVAELALRCLQLESEMRPTMDEVLDALKGIENGDYTMEKTEVVVIPDNDVGLLKNTPPPLSPDSVTDKWVSYSTTPSSSVRV